MTALIERPKRPKGQGLGSILKKIELPLSYPWLSPKAAAPYLGIHEETIRENCRTVWIRGVHFRATNGSGRRTYNRYQVNVEACAEWMNLPLDQR